MLNIRRLAIRAAAGLLLNILCLSANSPAFAQYSPEIIQVKDIKPGMKGVAYTIFSGDTVEPMELEVLGVLPNTLGPGQDIILIKLIGQKPEYTGVVAGMSGSPVFIEGKLAGALSLRVGVFTKEPVAGVTPIVNMYESSQPAVRPDAAATYASLAEPGAEIPPREIPIPAEIARAGSVPSGAYLMPIETPLVFSGFHPAALQAFGPNIAALGMLVTQGGTAEERPDDAEVKPGDMVSMVLVRGALSVNASCTVTAIQQDQVYVCGHPVFGYGDVAFPMARGRVVTTLASPLNSFKIVNAGGMIGTFTQDRLTAVYGRLGTTPKMIPMELALAGGGKEKKLQFELIEHPKLTPLLVAISAFNGLVSNTSYTDGVTFRLTGQMELEGHSAVSLENMFAPTDAGIPDGLFVALAVQNVFLRIFNNPFERAAVSRITLRVEMISERKWASIESAWCEKSEVSPGEKVDVKVMLRPYRGAPFIREVSIRIPEQAPRGPMRVLVSDADSLNRMTRIFAAAPQRLQGLEQLIKVINRERRNDRLYVSLLQSSPTLLLEEKELPNATTSQLNVLDQRRAGGNSLLLRESTAGEWSRPMGQVISGQQTLIITVK
jgi:hypothetical protein